MLNINFIKIVNFTPFFYYVWRGAGNGKVNSGRVTLISNNLT